MTPSSASSTSLLPRGVRRALDAMRMDVGRDWSVADLAATANQSSRTLQRQFKVFLGRTPREVLRDLRFELARGALLQSSPDAKVMDVALLHGFPHFGRFSIEYRRRYRETPSQTLKRQARLISVLASAPPIVVPHRDQPAAAIGPIEASPEHAEIARAVADDLANALMRTGLSVASQPRSARYHVAGALRGSGKQMRLTVRLIDAETGRCVSAHRSDGAPASRLSAEHFAARIAAALQPGLRLAEIERAARKPDAELSPRDLTLRAMPGALSLDADGNARAIELLARAIERDPDNALANALAAWAHIQRIVYYFTTTPDLDRARGAALARKALTVAKDATTLAVLGNAITLLHDLDTAETVIRKALAVDGGSAWAWSRSGWLDVYKGDADSAIERFKIALDLAPHDSLAFNSLVGIGCAHFNAGRYADAAHWQQRALLDHPSAIWVHRTLAPAYVLSGAQAEAQRSLATLREHHPDLTIPEIEQGLPPLPPASCALVVEALHAIGLPL